MITFLFRDVDIEAQFSLNQSRAEEITMREDYGSLSLVTHDQGFGDLGFDAEPPELLRHTSGMEPALDQVSFFIFYFILFIISDYYIVMNKIECAKFFQNIFLVNVDMCKIAKLYYFENNIKVLVKMFLNINCSDLILGSFAVIQRWPRNRDSIGTERKRASCRDILYSTTHGH